MSTTTTAAGPATSRSEAYRVLERIFHEGFAIGNDAIVDEICSPDLVEYQFGLAGGGAEAIAHVKAAIRAPRPARSSGRRATADRLHGDRRGPGCRRPDHRALGCRTGSPCWPRPACSTGSPEHFYRTGWFQHRCRRRAGPGGQRAAGLKPSTARPYSAPARSRELNRYWPAERSQCSR
jgi:hypothetical protein